MTHHCHAEGCQVEVRPTLLMCPKHWAMVPVDLRMPVVRNYRRGQCGDKRPSKEWVAAARKAIQYVAALEKGLL